jgi:two-component system sensor histidine kinase KdpD
MSHHMTQFDTRKGARLENQLRTAMLDSVTHELRTPLTSIKASVTALLTNSRLRPSQRNDLLVVINEEADRCWDRVRLRFNCNQAYQLCAPT